MRVWMIALLSLAAAVLGAAAFHIAPSAVGVAPPHAAMLVVIAIAAYAFVVLLLITAVLLADMRLLRERLAELADVANLTRQDLAAAFGTSRLQPLAITAAGQPAPPFAVRTTGAPPERIAPAAVRTEAARLQYIWLARAQFFLALALLGAIAAFGIAQQYQPLGAAPLMIPVAWCLAAVAALLLLAGLARLAIDTAAEMVVAALLQLPSEEGEARLLRRISDIVVEQTGGAAAAPSESGGFASGNGLAEHAVAAIEDGRRAFLGAAAELTEAAEALRSAVGSSTEALGASLQALFDGLPVAGQGGAEAGAVEDLQAAVDRLNDALEQLAAAPAAPAANEAPSSGGAPRRRVRDDRLAAELSRLLRDIDSEA